MRVPRGPMAKGIAFNCAGKCAGRTGVQTAVTSVGAHHLGYCARMTKAPTVQVERVLPAVGNFSVKEADAILEVAYLTTAADGKLTADEYESFRAVAAKLRAMAAGATSQVSDAALNKLFD